jgi:hypothetical protein
MNVTFKVREAFFDRPKVIKSLKAAKRKVLSKAGAFVRKRARSSMRRRKSASAPGSPPSAHSPNTHSLKTILFAYQPQSESTIVGPVQLNQVNFTIESVTSTVAGLHERGETWSVYLRRSLEHGFLCATNTERSMILHGSRISV